MLRARLLLSRVLVLCSGQLEVQWVRDGSIGSGLNRSIPFVGHSAFPFIGQENARVTAEGKRRTRESQRPSGSPGPSYPSCGSHRPCRCQQGRLHVVALSATGARCRLPVMALHSVLVDVMVN